MPEATNELCLGCVGLYGQPLTRQNGGPFRIVTPWKYGYKSPKSIVKISFGGKEKSLTMGPEQDEYEMEFPAMKASAKPMILHAVCTLDGEIAHERKITNVVIGDVWYVAATGLKEQGGPGLPRSGPAPPSLKASAEGVRRPPTYRRPAAILPTE